MSRMEMIMALSSSIREEKEDHKRRINCLKIQRELCQKLHDETKLKYSPYISFIKLLDRKLDIAHKEMFIEESEL